MASAAQRAFSVSSSREGGQPLLNDLHMQQPQKAAAEAEPQCDGGLRFKGEGGSIELEFVQRVPQKEFPALHADQFDPGAGQRLVGGENIAVFGVHQGVLHRHFADQGIVDSLGDRLVHAHSRSGIGLRIKITQEDALPGLRQGRGEIHTGGCFPHAAFLIHNRNGFCHVGTYFLKIPNKVEMLMLIYYSKRGRPLQGEKRKSREKEEKMFHVKQTAEKEPRMFHVKHPQPVTAKDGSPRAAAASAEHRRNREEYLR